LQKYHETNYTTATDKKSWAEIMLDEQEQLTDNESGRLLNDVGVGHFINRQDSDKTDQKEEKEVR